MSASDSALPAGRSPASSAKIPPHLRHTKPKLVSKRYNSDDNMSGGRTDFSYIKKLRGAENYRT